MSKLLIVAPSLKLGGIERALTTLATEFSRQGVDIVFVTCIKAEHFYTLPDGVSLIEPAFYRKGGFINKAIFYPLLLNFIRKVVSYVKPHRILVFGDVFSPLTLLALLGIKVPVFISDRTIPNYPHKFPVPQLKKWLYPNSAGFVAQTSISKKYKEKLFGDRLNIKVIPNALPSFDLSQNLKTHKEKRILYVGRFEWEKDPEILVRSMVYVKDANPEWEVYMAGSGPLLKNMKDLAESLKVESHIKFLGQVSNVQSLYQDAGIFVLPSVIEGFPNALIEAMSFGLPCICFSDIPYQDIAVHERNAIVLRERSPEVLGSIINGLINNEDLRKSLGEKALEIRQKLDASKVADEFLRFMEVL